MQTNPQPTNPHPADTDWLAFNGNWEFSQAYETEAEALEAAEDWEANN